MTPPTSYLEKIHGDRSGGNTRAKVPNEVKLLPSNHHRLGVDVLEGTVPAVAVDHAVVMHVICPSSFLAPILYTHVPVRTVLQVHRAIADLFAM